MLLFFLHIAHHLSHKSYNDTEAVVRLLSSVSLFPYARYLEHSMQKLRGASFDGVLYAKRKSSVLFVYLEEAATYSSIYMVVLFVRELNCSV